jgi:CRISPR-associated endonuclease Csn1
MDKPSTSKLVFGLDVGTNSVGWAAVKSHFEESEGKILGLGSRILPMDQAEIGDFNKGNLQSAAAQRTEHRGVRRLRERQIKRRERLVKVLKVLGFIDQGWEPNHRYSFAFETNEDRTRFKFQDSYQKMRSEFSAVHPDLKEISHDWTIYYLRKKALTERISNQELAWLILQFNVKRGYFQLRGDNDLDTDNSKYFVADIVDNIEDAEDDLKGRKLLMIHLRNGIVGEYRSREIPEWIGKEVEFIVTEKTVKDKLKVSLTSPDENDWTLRKKKTEGTIKSSNLTVGAYIYDKLLADPQIKIRGKEVHTIDRKFYKNELLQILEQQSKYHEELTSSALLQQAARKLYKNNTAHRENLIKRGAINMIVDDIIYYQRPLKTKKHLIANCKYESYSYKDRGGVHQKKHVKGIAKSHPLFQEFRIWDVIHNIKIIALSTVDDSGVIRTDADISDSVFGYDAKAKLFDAFDKAKELSHNQILKAIGLNNKEYKINYEDGSKLKGNEFKAAIIKVCKKENQNDVIKLLSDSTLLEQVWHVVYSLGDSEETLKAGLANPKLNLTEELQFALLGMPSFSKEYGSFSRKALSKLVPLMRCGKYWGETSIHPKVIERIELVINAEEDDAVADNVRMKLYNYSEINQFQGLNITDSSYVAYNRHSEVVDAKIFKVPEDIDVNVLMPNHSLRNPTAEKVIRETLLVVRDMWKEYGKPDEIHVEMARELKLPNDKRKEYTYRRNENYVRNQRAKAMLVELSKDDSNINPFSTGHLETFKIFEEGAVKNEKLIDKDIAAIRKKGDPTQSELTRYKLWLEQKYTSPYTGKMIPLSKLFTDSYEIEHIIPKALFYDDSFNNKIICERSANRFKKDRTAYEMICNAKEAEVENGVQLLSKDVYERRVKEMFASINYKKYKNLMQFDPPKGFSERQLNNTRYINRKLLEVLSPIVREEEEVAATSKHIISMQGGVTSQLKNDWGLHDVWKRILAPRFQRMNELSESTDYYNKVGNRIDLSGYENEIKRLDHRHHALDALVIACTTRNHVTYKNSLKSENKRPDLKSILLKNRDKNNRRSYILPWNTIAVDAFDALDKVIVSFKNNVRVINKTINYYQKYIQQADGSWKKGFVKQKTNHDHWAVRKPLHQETIYGRLSQVEYKTVTVNAALQDIDKIANRQIKRQLKKLADIYKNDVGKIKKYLKVHPLEMEGEPVSKIAMRVVNDKIATSRMKLDSGVTKVKLDRIVDPNMQKKLMQHFEENNSKADEAFSETGLAKFNKHRHNAVKSVKIKQDLGIAFPLGDGEMTRHKYGKGAKGTNLYFVIYRNLKTGEHLITTNSTMSFNDLLEIEKAKEDYAEHIEGFDYFTLSPGDLVYIDTDERGSLPKGVNTRMIYKCVSFSKQQCFFVPHRISSLIVEGKELSVKNKMEKSIDNIMIKSRCLKLKVDRLGTIVRG